MCTLRAVCIRPFKQLTRIDPPLSFSCGGTGGCAFCSYVESLRSSGRFPSTEAEAAGGGDGEMEMEPEETLAWTLFLRAQLEERTGFLIEAFETLEVRIGCVYPPFMYIPQRS